MHIIFLTYKIYCTLKKTIKAKKANIRPQEFVLGKKIVKKHILIDKRTFECGW